MTVISMGVCLLVGVVLLLIGVGTKKKWIKVIAILPLSIVIINIIVMLVMGVH